MTADRPFVPPPEAAAGLALREPLARGWWHLVVPRLVVGESWATHPAALAATTAWQQALQRLEDELSVLPANLARHDDERSRTARWTMVARRIAAWRATVLVPGLTPSSTDAPVWPVGSPWWAAAVELRSSTGPEDLAWLGRSLQRATPATLGSIVRPLDPAVQQAAAALVSTYGLESLAMHQVLALGAMQLQRLQRTSAALAQACAHLGIAPATWGRVAPHLVLSQPVRANEFDAGAVYDTDTATVALLRARTSAGQLAHEWTHALDHWTLRRHRHPAIASDLCASDWLTRTTVQTRQDLDLPVALQRSLAIVGRLVEEVRGEQPPLLEHRAFRRFAERMAARIWAHRAWREDRSEATVLPRGLADAVPRPVVAHDSPSPSDPGRATEPYWSAAPEMLAHLVQHHHRSHGTARLGQSWRHPGRMAPLNLPGTMRLVRAWIEAEGLQAAPAVEPASSPALRRGRPR